MGSWQPDAGASGATDAASDVALVARAKHDPDAFGWLYARHRDRLVRYCFYRLGDWADAEDAANEAFTKAFVRIASFTERGDAFTPWLFRIAHNEVIDRHRRRRVRADLPLAAAADRADPRPLPDEAAADADAHDRLLALLDALSEDQRQVLKLRLAGLTGTEIAAVLGKRHDAVRQLQSRALERLRTLVAAAGAETVGRGPSGD